MTTGTIAGTTLLGCNRDFLARKPEKPNIILIMADDLGAECLSCYGSLSCKTPHLDHLAKTGIRFNHCYSQPVCTPSRVKIMTGKYNFRNYISFGILDPNEKTFAHMLKNAGYKTCVAGKWQLYGSISNSPKVRGKGILPKQAGFDEFCLWQVEQRGFRYSDPLISTNSITPQEHNHRYGPDVFCEYILDFIERNSKRPFFVYYPMALVHDPFVPTPDNQDWPENKYKKSSTYFPDMVAYMDKIVDRIAKKLDKLNLRRNTIMLFTADNGTAKAITTKTTTGYVLGGKATTTNAGTHVPLIANCPALLPQGKICDVPIDFSDFYPTIAELAQISIKAESQIDGRSFVPQLLVRKGDPKGYAFCYYGSRRKYDPENVFIRTKNFKLYADNRLFDMQNDHTEQNPILPEKDTPQTAGERKHLQSILHSILSTRYNNASNSG